MVPGLFLLCQDILTPSVLMEESTSSRETMTRILQLSHFMKLYATTLQGKGFVIAVFDRNATGSLAPFNGMMVVGTHEEDPSIQAATIILWEWQSGIPLPSNSTTEEPPLMNTATMTDTTAGVSSSPSERKERWWQQFWDR